ncbi:MAG: FAD-dependent oxidoreductase [Fimbriimonadaceae bacterium]
MKVAVVGAGIVGASAARHLAEAGHEVTVFEPFEPAHGYGSSHGASRIVRKAYPDPFYTAVMKEAYPLWADLERASGKELVTECGLAYFGSEASPLVQSMIAGLRENNVPFDILGPKEALGPFPAMRLADDEVMVYTAEAGWVAAARAVRATIGCAVQSGATIVNARVNRLDALEQSFDAVAIAAGGWIQRFVSLPAKVTVQTYAHLGARLSGPVWIEDDFHNDHLYGFPSAPGDDWVKIGVHGPGPEVDPDGERPGPDEAVLARLRQVMERRFGVPDAPVLEAVTCLYTTLPGDDFKFGRISEKSVFASACSGHGFKAGPWTGQMLARLATGEPFPEWLRERMWFDA